MTEFKKENLSTRRSKIELIRNIPLSSSSPLTQPATVSQKSSASEPVTPTDLKPAADVPEAIVKPETFELPPQPKVINTTTPEKADGRVQIAARIPFTYAFSYELLPLAEALAAKIPCKVEDLGLAISRQFNSDALDLSIVDIKPRLGPSTRVNLRIPSHQIEAARQLRDPLGLRTDGYLLRFPVVAALDEIAAIFLKEMKERYDA